MKFDVINLFIKINSFPGSIILLIYAINFFSNWELTFGNLCLTIMYNLIHSLAFDRRVLRVLACFFHVMSLVSHIIYYM